MNNASRASLLKMRNWAVLGVALLAIFPALRAQGPRVQYFYQPQTELSWAQCHVYLQGGSRQAIPFLPVVSTGTYRAPLGAGNYEKDITLDGPLVFIGNGIAQDNGASSYIGRRADFSTGNLDVAGKIVMFCYDFPDAVEEKLGTEITLARRVAEAASRKAAAIVLFSARKDYPFLTLDYAKGTEVPGFPVITINKTGLLSILACAGLDGDALLKDWQESKKPPRSEELISRLSLELKGKFDRVESANFLFRTAKDSISAKDMREVVRINEKALAFLMKTFEEDKGLKWPKLSVTYFRDYDAKVFFTHHWGLGLASAEGTFMVYLGTPNFPLAVHENAHILTAVNWGGSSSFLMEGVGKYTEALAEDQDKNHLETLKFLKERKLFRLKELASFQIGMPGLETDVGYPAAGSFVDFLIETRGLTAFKEAYAAENRPSDQKDRPDTWLKVFGKSLQDLEREWLIWLGKTHKADEPGIQTYLETIAREK